MIFFIWTKSNSKAFSCRCRDINKIEKKKSVADRLLVWKDLHKVDRWNIWFFNIVTISLISLCFCDCGYKMRITGTLYKSTELNFTSNISFIQMNKNEKAFVGFIIQYINSLIIASRYMFIWKIIWVKYSGNHL